MKSLLFLAAVIALFSAASAQLNGIAGCVGKCPLGQPNNDVYFLPHRNCSQYCSCNFGTPYVTPCPPGLHYSVKDRVCDWPFTANCKYARQIDEPIALLRAGSSSQCRGSCPASDPADLIVTLEHEECGKYCKCWRGVTTEHQCPADFHFSALLGTCTYPEEAECPRWTTTSTTSNGCCACPDTTSSTSPVPHRPNTTTTHVTVPHRPNTTTTHVTVTHRPNTTTTHVTVPHRPNTTTTHVTVPHRPSTTTPVPDASGCIGECSDKNNSGDVEQLPHELCSKFCKCDFGKKVVVDCPRYPVKQYYNPDKQVCDYPQDAGCTGRRD